MRGVRRHPSLMRHTLSLSFAKNALWILFVMLLAIGSSSCKDEKDEPDNPLDPKNETPQVSPDSYSVVINSDGTASGGAVFSRLDGTTFFLDYVKYKVVDSHLEIIDYDPTELPSTPKLYSEVTLEGALYKTRIICQYAFALAKIKSITIPKNVTTISYDSFSNCTFLTSISLPDGLTSIRSHCFSHCTSLTSITLPDDITSIGEYCFNDCTSLSSIKLPDGLTSIGNCCFNDCTSLSSITLPDGLTSIGEYCFNDCTSLFYNTSRWLNFNWRLLFQRLHLSLFYNTSKWLDFNWIWLFLRLYLSYFYITSRWLNFYWI